MGSDEADALDAFDRMEQGEKIGEIFPFGRAFPIGIDILPEQCDLLVPLLGECSHLLYDGYSRAALLAPPGIGDHAERAKLIAPLHHGHPGLPRITAVDRKQLFIPERIVRDITELPPTRLH